MAGWTAHDIPDLRGMTAVVTGANKGLGFHTALELVRHGATVTLGCRDSGRGEEAVRRIRSQVPDGSVELEALDLADLASVRRFADAFGDRHRRLDILVNNAGLLGLPRLTTADGFEMQFGVNYLGHFALTGLLLPALLAGPGARVVNLTTWVININSAIDFDNLQGEKKYDKWDAYLRSKLANVVFGKELSRRYSARGLIGMSAHPGFAVSDLQYAAPRLEGSRIKELFFKIPTLLFAKPTSRGALPSLYAACAPGVAPGACYGPTGPGQIRGRTGQVKMPAAADDPELGARLWKVSEEITGVYYDS